MRQIKSTTTNDRAGIIACAILGIACLVMAYYHVQTLLPLLQNGKRAEAVVTGIDIGARNTKWAIYEFVTDTGKTVTARDVFQMYIHRPDKGNILTVLYDPTNPEIVTADRGMWNWEGAGIFLFGFVLFLALGLFILWYRKKQENIHD